MAKLEITLSLLQCHMILQKSF